MSNQPHPKGIRTFTGFYPALDSAEKVHPFVLCFDAVFLCLPRRCPFPRAAPAVDSDPHCGGGDEDRHLPADSSEADTAGPGKVPPTEPEDALPHQGH